MKERKFIPIKTLFDPDMWYMEITNANLSELIKLKKQLNGINNDAIIMLDGMIRDNIGYSDSESKLYRREDNTISTMKKRKQFVKKVKHKRR